jgi:hypothetical protein
LGEATVEPYGRAEPFAVVNTKQAADEESRPKAHTLTPLRLSAPPPNVIMTPPARHGVTETSGTSGTSFAQPQIATLLAQRPDRPVENVVRLPAPTAPEYSFDLRQQWEGVVTEVERDEFTVVLRDTLNPDAPEFDATLPLEEVTADDFPLLQPGAVLYWAIGYERTRTGQVKRVSTIRLRRLPAWSKADIERVDRRARDLDVLFRE